MAKPVKSTRHARFDTPSAVRRVLEEQAIGLARTRRTRPRLSPPLAVLGEDDAGALCLWCTMFT